MTSFTVVPGTVVSKILASAHHDLLRVVAETYLAHEDGLSVNPDSYFLRFPEKPDSRVIALPAYLGGEVDTIGIKWIASFPGNVSRGLPRASAVLLLNDAATGYPIACLEAAGISAARTAASAALAAGELVDGPVRVAFVGAGVIARTIADYLRAVGTQPTEVLVHDRDEASARHLMRHAGTAFAVPSRVVTAEEALEADVVVLATTAPSPWVPAEMPLRPGQVLLNISLRDLPPEILLRSNNIVDDVDHCLKADTSPHLTEQRTGNRDFVTGTLGALLRGKVELDRARPVVFSPFGLGILDLAVGHHVLRSAEETGAVLTVPDFIGEPTRW